MKRYGKDYKLTQNLMNTIAVYMDDEIREKVHFEFAPCEPETFIMRYLAIDPSFMKILKNEFGIEIETEDLFGKDDPLWEEEQKMASPWEALVELYDKLRAAGKPVCPIAHTCMFSRKTSCPIQPKKKRECFLGYMSRFIGYMVKLSNDKIKPPEKANNAACMDFKGTCCPERAQVPFLCQQIIVQTI